MKQRRNIKFYALLFVVIISSIFLIPRVWAITNKAAVYCEALGFEYKDSKCKINDKEFNDWDFYKGKVGKEFSYCAKKGYEIETRVVDKGSYTEEFAVCVKGKEEKPLEQLMEEDGIILIKEEEKVGGKDFKNAELKASKTVPSAFDWRNKDGRTYIGPVRNQGSCGSCYAFSALAAAEGNYNWATGRYDGNCADFSEAFMAFCLSDYYVGFNGCSGAGYYYQELDALVDPGMGINNEAVFPYNTSWSTANEPTCLPSYWNAPRVRFERWARIDPLDTEAMKTAMMNYGALDVAVNVKQAFQRYSGGVYTDSQTTCPDGNQTTTNHGVALVGWGYNATYGLYWILRNSWGPYWGENGYMRIAATSARVACESTFVIQYELVDINLIQGWNLISLPLQPSDTSIDYLISDLSGQIVIQYYNASTGGWTSYDTAAAFPGLNTLNSMSYGNAYWLKSTLNQTLTIQGSIVRNHSISLVSGWNFVGFNSSTTAMPNAINRLTNPIIVWDYDTLTDKWKVYDTSAMWPNTLTNMTAGKGYWLRSNVEQGWRI